jgi:hypothetical protein
MSLRGLLVTPPCTACSLWGGGGEGAKNLQEQGAAILAVWEPGSGYTNILKTTRNRREGKHSLLQLGIIQYSTAALEFFHRFIHLQFSYVFEIAHDFLANVCNFTLF